MTKNKIIQVQNFTKSFGQKNIYNDVHFHVFEGECLGLLGGSGTGKSVLLRSLVGLEKPDRGEILIEHENIVKKTEQELFAIRKKVAYVFQNGALFDSMNVFENVSYALREHTQLPEEEIVDLVNGLLSNFNLPGAQNLYPAELSGGMQKRIGLARAIVLDPKVILYDEPTAGLDPANTVMIQNLILKLRSRGTTAILVTHDMDTALRVCDRICFVKDQSIIDLGEVAAIRENRDRLTEYFLRGQT